MQLSCKTLAWAVNNNNRCGTLRQVGSAQSTIYPHKRTLRLRHYFGKGKNLKFKEQSAPPRKSLLSQFENLSDSARHHWLHFSRDLQIATMNGDIVVRKNAGNR